MAVNVNPSNNMWQGGAIHHLSPPTASSGGIAAANTSVSSPVGGVNPGAPFFTRPNTGSNIRVPYNRLCPLSSEAGGGLPPGPLTAAEEANWGMESDKLGYGTEMTTDLRARGRTKTETEDLHASRVAFILGKRSSFTSGPGTNPAHPFLDAYGINQALSTGVGSVHRMQKLCSMEYLERYFANRLAGMHIDLSKALNVNDWKTGLLKQTAIKVKGKSGYTFNGSMAAMPDLCRDLADDKTEAKDPKRNAVLQGVFAHDNGPFLHGKPVKHELLESRSMTSGELDNWRRRFPHKCDRALGNEVAFAALLDQMEKIGLMDWTPDGIVLSKGTNDPSDKLNDEFIEARDGALFNIVVQGPTLSTSWSGKKELAVLPMDKVFIVIVADLWRLSTTEYGQEEYKCVTAGDRWGADELKAYKALLASQGAARTTASSATLDAKAGHEILVNFRVRMSTSSEMVSYSNLKFHNSKPVEGSRMGLKHGEKMSEYIVGGWHLGNVMDSAASRRAMPGSGNITMRTAPNTMAHNINVNIEWWSGDRLWDAFMNKEGKLRERYQVSLGALEKAENKPQV